MTVEEFQNDIVALARIHKIELRILAWADNKLIAKLRAKDGKTGFLMFWEMTIFEAKDCSVVNIGMEYLIKQWGLGNEKPQFTVQV